MDQYDREDVTWDTVPPPHYYGNVVRACFIGASLLLLGDMLVDWALLSFYLTVGVISVVVFVILAGLTSPRTRLVLYAEAIVSGVGFVFFEYAAIAAYIGTPDSADPVFWLRQLLAVLFLVALYYVTKSLRGMTAPGNEL